MTFSSCKYRDIDPFKDRFIRYRNIGKPVTYLVGAKCTDGIVIVSDSRLIAEYDVETGNKILQLDDNIVIGAAGGTRFFKKFLNQLNDSLKEKPPKSVNETITTAEDIIFTLYERYGKRARGESIDCFIAISDIWKKYMIYTNNVKLFALDKEGSAVPIDGIKALGHAEPYGAMFLKILWNKSYSMRQTAELVKFVIDTVYSLGLDVTVDHRLQYFCIPYEGEPDFMPFEDMEVINENVKKMMVVFNTAMSDIREMQHIESLKAIDTMHNKKRGRIKEYDDVEIYPDELSKNKSEKPSGKISKKKRTIS